MIKTIIALTLLIFSTSVFAGAGNNFASQGTPCQFKGTIKADSVGNFLFCGTNSTWSPSPLAATVSANKKAIAKGANVTLVDIVYLGMSKGTKAKWVFGSNGGKHMVLGSKPQAIYGCPSGSIAVSGLIKPCVKFN